MVVFLVFLVCFAASVVGSICGIGGGVIIKPVLDAFGIMDVSTLSFLSGCTVLSMTTYSGPAIHFLIHAKQQGPGNARSLLFLRVWTHSAPVTLPNPACGGLFWKIPQKYNWLFMQHFQNP